MKIVVLDGYTLNPGDLDWKGLEEFGECKIYDRTPIQDTQEIIRRIGDAQAVFTNKTPLPREVFETCGNIEFVGVLATGYNVVDIEAAKERNIPVSNIPTYGTAAVGQFAIALLLEICHHIGYHSEAVREGKWVRWGSMRSHRRASTGCAGILTVPAAENVSPYALRLLWKSTAR